MRTVQSDRIHDLLRSSAKVESEIATHAPEVALLLEARFAPRFPSAEEGPVPDFLAILMALKDELSDSRKALSSNETRHVDLIRLAIELRDERDEIADELYRDFAGLRRAVEELYGRGAFVLAGIQGPTAQKPSKLLHQVRYAVKHLLDPEVALPPARFGALAVDPRRLAQELQQRAARLSRVLSQIQQVQSELNATRKEKNRAMVRHRNTFLWVARNAESYFQLAGEDELAERIRPSVRRRGRRAVEVDETDEPSDAPDAGEPPDESPDEPPGEPAGDEPEVLDEPDGAETGAAEIFAALDSDPA